MEFAQAKDNSTVSYCFPSHNLSCVKMVRSKSEYIFLYIFFAVISLFTVFMNLLIIISICHFKQLHTPTNLVLLSLAISDFIVGLIVIPIESSRLIESCWYFGQIFCSIFQAIVYIVVFVLLHSLLLIAVDRYYAICEPLLYCSKMTGSKTSLFILFIWLYSVIYNVTLLYCNANYGTEESNMCHGECGLVLSFTWGIVDLCVVFIGPCTVIIGMYLHILKVAQRQEKSINAVVGRFKSSTEMPARTKTSERKATKTLGIVLFVFITCWIIHYICILSSESLPDPYLATVIVVWIIYINSFLNPIIYAFRYSWFRASVKHILSLKIIVSGSGFTNLITDCN